MMELDRRDNIGRDQAHPDPQMVTAGLNVMMATVMMANIGRMIINVVMMGHASL